MAITVAEAIELLKNFAKEEHAYKEEYDNIGLIVGDRNAQVNRVLCCLDVTSRVLDEAIEKGVQLIISHHPFIFYPIKNITTDSVHGRNIIKAISHGINIYAAHTNLDFVKGGINEFVATQLGLRNLIVLQPYIDSEQGLGRVGELPNRTFVSTVKKVVENILKDNFIRIIGDANKMVKRIAVINGGGGGDTNYIDLALRAGADCLITADIKHHVAVYAQENDIVLIEPQHYTMEHCYLSRLVQILKLEAKSSKMELEIMQSVTDINPRF